MWFLSSLSCSFPSLSVLPCLEAPAVMLGCLIRDTRSFAPFQPHASLVASSQPFSHLSEPFASSHPWNSLSLSPSLPYAMPLSFFLWWLTPSCVIIRALPLYNMFLFSLADKGGIWSEGYGVRLTEMRLRGGNLCSGPATLRWPHRSRSERPETIQKPVSLAEHIQSGLASHRYWFLVNWGSQASCFSSGAELATRAQKKNQKKNQLYYPKPIE